MLSTSASHRANSIRSVLGTFTHGVSFCSAPAGPLRTGLLIISSSGCFRFLSLGALSPSAVFPSQFILVSLVFGRMSSPCFDTAPGGLLSFLLAPASAGTSLRPLCAFARSAVRLCRVLRTAPPRGFHSCACPVWLGGRWQVPRLGGGGPPLFGHRYP